MLQCNKVSCINYRCPFKKILLKQNSLRSGKAAVKPEIMLNDIKNKKVKWNKMEYTVTVGKHTVKGKADNPKVAKNRAAGELLKRLQRNFSDVLKIILVKNFII